MIILDQEINKLVLKWANNVNGKWSDVEHDLLEYAAKIRADERAKIAKEFGELDEDSELCYHD